jgi:hypothetical protein
MQLVYFIVIRQSTAVLYSHDRYRGPAETHVQEIKGAPRCQQFKLTQLHGNLHPVTNKCSHLARKKGNFQFLS